MLSEEDKKHWAQITKEVTPLGESPVEASQSLPRVRVPRPHAVAFDACMDLHGETIHTAFGLVKNHVEQGWNEGHRKLLVITGRSGQINVELPKWLEGNPHVRSVNQRNGGGAWEICLKKRNT